VSKKCKVKIGLTLVDVILWRENKFNPHFLFVLFDSFTKLKQFFMRNSFLLNVVRAVAVVFALVLGLNQTAQAQVTSGAISGIVTDAKGEGMPGAAVIAVHVPSGTRYVTISEVTGDYNFPNVRIGGPYKITVTFTGYKEEVIEGFAVNLGSTIPINVTLQETSVQLATTTVTAERYDLLTSKKTGAGATLGSAAINSLPTLTRRLDDVTKYNAYGTNNGSFAGQDPRLNSFTIDGATFNNGFGLGNSAIAGGRTNASAISLDAIEEIQINVAPYDIRQSNFSGAGVNAVTRSGTNDLKGSAFYFLKNENLIGKNLDTFQTLVPRAFNEQTYGMRLGGPIIKDKLFFFVNYETTTRSTPALDFVATRQGASGNVSAVSADSLDALTKFLQEKFNYALGPYENFNSENNSTKYLARIDWNINDMHKLTLRYAHHDSQSDAVISGSNSGFTAGNGNRQNSSIALSGQNTGYIILDNTRSGVAELNSNFNSKWSNNFIATYNQQIEDRKYRTALFPTVDILDVSRSNASTFVTTTSIGFDPFTPNNKLNYSTLNFTDNVTYYAGKHTFVFGAAYEKYESNNVFFPSSNGVYVYNSYADFYKAAQAYLDNPAATTSPVIANRYNLRYSNLPGGAEPLQKLGVTKISAYVQDEIRATKNFKVTIGVRADNIAFDNTALKNTLIDSITAFKDENGKSINVNTAVLPTSTWYLSPRVGFNWDLTGNRNTTIRGGSGVFLSSVPYVWISNQVGNNGILTGLVSQTNTTAYPFTLDPTKFAPAGGYNLWNPANTFDINATDPNFRFPQIWKTNLAVDQRIWGGLVGTLEVIYNQNINTIQYIDANLTPASNSFKGPDSRPRFPGSGLSTATINQGGLSTSLKNNAARLAPNVLDAYVLRSTNVGSSYTFTAKLEKPISRNWGGLLAYTYGQARDLMSGGSTAGGTFGGIRSVNGPNQLELSYTDNDLRHRVVGYLNYRLNYGGKIGGTTTFTLGMNAQSGYKVSYAYGGDMNGDNINGNDLLYIPYKATDLRFAPVTYTPVTGGAPRTFTPEQQAAAFDKFIEGNDYLATRRGQYAERNGGYSPTLMRMDFSVEQDFYVKVGSKTNILRFRADIFNFTNLLNKSWGIGYRTTSSAPLNYVRVDADGVPVYTLAAQVLPGNATTGTQTILLQDSFVKNINTDNAWNAQLGVRYIFN
jgi:Carboxypeptidase regulatory-like domain